MSVPAFQYSSTTDQDRAEMLREIGVGSFEELVAQIPRAVRLGRALNLEPARTEWELRQHMIGIASANANAETHACFLGAGCYDHYVPAVVDSVAERGEFLTSYTPYQPEMSQGLLQALHEYTDSVGKLLGRDVVNCSHYDSATALAEAAVMCMSATGRRSVVVAQTIWTEHRTVLDNYLWGRGIQAEVLASDSISGRIDLAALEAALTAGSHAACVIQSPNSYGVIEDIPAIASRCAAHGTKLVVAVHPLLMGIQRSPGELGADVVVAEGQALGLPMSAGGPHLGIIATSDALRRWMPGRLVGRVTDLHGRPAFALVYEDREQHVARQRATSNICSNQALNAIRVATYLSLVGDSGMRAIAKENAGKARALRYALVELPGVKAAFNGPIFNEFVVQVDGVPAAQVFERMAADGIFAGVTASHHPGLHQSALLIAVTESRTGPQLRAYVESFARAIGDLRGAPLTRAVMEAACNKVGPDGVAEATVRALAELPQPRTSPVGLGDRGEVDVVRHFTNLSRSNFGVDTGPYPLGSCTMKYNPKRNDAYADLPGFRHVHPLQPSASLAGLQRLYRELQRDIAELTGMDAVDLSPAAGAHGELKGLMVARRYFESRGESQRRVVIVPDSAHGTNPASAAMVGYEVRIVATRSDGLIDIDALEAVVGEDTAVVMLTNPSTLGLFEREIARIEKATHRVGALLYYDGANLNALMGLSRPGDMGFDIVHLNVHKTLSTPHGGGGPGAGPVGVKDALKSYISLGFAAQGIERLDRATKVKAFNGHVGVLVKAYAYIRTMGPDGLLRASQDAILCANYLQARLRQVLPPVFDSFCMHECLLDGSSLDVPVLDLAKRMIDYGVHPPTLMGAGCVYFDRALNAAMLIEPTETESKASLDLIVDTVLRILAEAKSDPALVGGAPHTMRVGRLSTAKEQRC